jgi:hypothetical protein
MNGSKRLTNKVGWVICALLGGVLVWMLTGGTSYQVQPRHRDAYDEPSPQADTSYAAKEDQNKKGQEQEASPENPDVSPQSPH